MRSSDTLQASLVLCLAFALLAGTLAADAHSRTVTVGVVRDGPGAAQGLLSAIEEEIKRLVPKDVTVDFKAAPGFNAGWDGTRVEAALERALSDPEVDIVLGAGYVVTVTAARDDILLSKPFLSISFNREDIPELPLAGDGTWLKENFNATVIEQRADEDLEELERILVLDTLYVAIDPLHADYLPGLDGTLAGYERDYGFAVELLRVPGGAAGAPAQIPRSARMVYLTELPRLSRRERGEFIAGLTGLGIATYSMMGHGDVELGALVATIPDMQTQLARRVALNLSRLIRGRPVSGLPVFLTVDMSVLMNGRTAEAIGYSPDFQVLAFAQFIHREALGEGEELLTLEEALAAAVEGNVELAIKDADLESAYRGKQRALSPLLPQVLGSAGYMKDEPIRDTGLLPTELASAGVQVSQTVFDDRTISDYRSSDRLHESAGFERETERLDVLADAGGAYLEFALARVLLKVQADNAALTEDNLELSKIRYEAGYSGKDEVFRWEAELAQSRTQLLETNTAVEAARIALNQVLGIEQNLRWTPEEFEIDQGAFTVLGTHIRGTLRSPDALKAFREFMVVFGTETSPELLAYDKAIEAQEIQYGQRKRKWVLPSFYANFTYDYIFDYEPLLGDARDDTYRFEFGAAYPIFNGADRYQDMKLQQSELEKIRRERELVRQRVEQRVRTAVRRLEGSFPSLALTKQAAESSRLNLEVVQDKYSQGIVNITDLLEAQNASFSADQNAAAAVYSFLDDTIVLQRAISWFEFEHSDEEIEEIARRIRAAVEAQ